MRLHINTLPDGVVARLNAVLEDHFGIKPLRTRHLPCQPADPLPLTPEPLMPDDLGPIRSRLAAASPGPWLCEHPPGGKRCFPGSGLMASYVRPGKDQWPVAHCYGENLADAEFVAAAREDVAYLLAEVERMRGLLCVRALGLDDLVAPSTRAAAVAELEQSCRSAVRDRAIANALAGRPLAPGMAVQLIRLWRDRLTVYEEGGEFKVRVSDGRSVNQAVNEWLAE